MDDKKKSVKKEKNLAKQKFISVSRIAADSYDYNYHGYDHDYHGNHCHKHDHHGHDHHERDNHGEKRKRADSENQRRLSNHKHNDKISVEYSSSKNQSEIKPNIQEINESDYENESATLNNEAIDVKYKLSQEYFHILKTINEQNKYLDKMRNRILSTLAQTERQGLPSVFCDEQTKLNEDLEKAMILRSNWLETSNISEESDGCGQEMKDDTSGNNTCSGSGLPSDSSGNNANEYSDFLKTETCCCSTNPTSSAVAESDLCYCRSNGTCCCSTNPILFQTPNNCCCMANIFGYTTFSY